MGGSDGEEELLDLQDTMLPTPSEEEKSTMTDCADQEVDPAHTEVKHCQLPAVVSMDIDDAILQSENATWSLMPSADKEKQPSHDHAMMNVEKSTLHSDRSTSHSRSGSGDSQVFPVIESDNDEVHDHTAKSLSSEETSATDHTASNESVAHVIQNDTPVNDDVGADLKEIEGLPDYGSSSGDLALGIDEQSPPAAEIVIADTVTVKTEETDINTSLEVRNELTTRGSTGHSSDAGGDTFDNAITKGRGDGDELASQTLQSTPSTHSSTQKVRFKEETPKNSPKPKQEAEPYVKSEHPINTPWQEVAPKFEGNDCKPPTAKTQSKGPARTPREAVQREIQEHLRRRRVREAKKKHQAPQKRKSDVLTEQPQSKVSRKSEDDNAAMIAHIMPVPGRDLSRVRGFDGDDHQDETPEDEDEQTVPDGDDEPNQANMLEDEEEPEELDMLDFDLKRAVTSANISALKKIQKVFGHGRASIHGTDGLKIENMASPLWKEQARAVYWMVNQEEIAIGPRGGVLAAGMGTGKTVMSLGIIAGNPPLEDDLQTYSHATLVVVPNQKLARQWKEKIAEHCNAAFAKESLAFEPKKGRLPAFLQMRKVVVTTYAEVCKQRPGGAALRDLKHNWNNPKWRKALPSGARTSPLYYVNWYRIILDEAHKISNKETKTFKACRDLKAKYRWCLSGTPLANSDAEMFPYLSFLACDFANTFTTFFSKFKVEQEQQLKGKEGSRPHLDALMGLVLYRYKLGDVVTLGEARDIHVPLSAEENLIFDNLKLVMSRQPSKLPRLRLMVSHMFNLDRMFCTDFGPGELDGLIEKLKELQNRRSVFEVLEQQSTDPAAIQVYSAGLSKIRDTLEDGQHDLFQFEPLLSKIKEEQELRKKACTRCTKTPSSWNWVTSYNCLHLFCSDCLPPPPRPARDEKCSHPDCETRMAFGGFVLSFARLATLALGSNGPSPATDVNGTQVVKIDDRKPAILLSSRGHIPTPPSTKLIMAAAVILTWRKNHPEDKIVVFLEFHTSAHVLGSLLRIAGERFLYIFGNTGDTKTQLALNRFRSKDMSTPILIAGLKSVGEGLNLTEANRVITIDLWYNNAREDQAFARVHRIGQTKPTYFVRIVSEGDKILTTMQDRKAKEVSYAMKEDGHKVRTLDRIAFNALFAKDPKEADDDGSEDEDEDDEEGDMKVARSAKNGDLDTAELGSLPRTDSTSEHDLERRGVEDHSVDEHGVKERGGIEEHGFNDHGMTADDPDAHGAVQNDTGGEKSDTVDNACGDQSQVMLLQGS